MAFTLAYRVAGASMGLSVVATTHAAVPVTPTDNTLTPFLLFENTSTTVAVFVTVVGVGPNQTHTAPASVLPGDGTVGSICVLPGQAKVLSCPVGPLSVSAIGAAAGPSLLIVTPVVPI